LHWALVDVDISSLKMAIAIALPTATVIIIIIISAKRDCVGDIQHQHRLLEAQLTVPDMLRNAITITNMKSSGLVIRQFENTVYLALLERSRK
jgi:hypothetical protein